jgi:catechol 2,3-dioxygenase-like lactoylglutathione lyase family enzyme
VARQVQIAIDCQDPELLAAFWVDVLGYEVRKPPAGNATWADYSRTVAVVRGEAWCMIVDPDGAGPPLLFHSVPEGKAGKNRVHLDISVAPGRPPDACKPLVDAEAERLVALGATHVRTDEDDHDYYAVMQDPEGNEFCVG